MLTLVVVLLLTADMCCDNYMETVVVLNAHLTAHAALFSLSDICVCNWLQLVVKDVSEQHCDFVDM